MFKEMLRKLTSNYTEDEYKEYLNESLLDAPSSRKYYSSINGDESIKDIACDLACVACDTGYEAEFLYEMFDEQVQDRTELGDTYFEARRGAFDFVVGVSYEMDW